MSDSKQKVYCAGCGASALASESDGWETCDQCGDLYCPDCSGGLVSGGICDCCDQAITEDDGEEE